MRLFWTIQPLEVLESLQACSELAVDPARICDGYVPPGYIWMSGQMKKRMPDAKPGLPWWLNPEKPDLRCFRHTRPLGHREVRLKLALPKTQYLIFTLKDWEPIFQGPKPQPSWERLFEPIPENDDEELVAVTDRLRLSQVKRITPFVGTNKLFLETLEMRAARLREDPHAFD